MEIAELVVLGKRIVNIFNEWHL